MSEPIPKQVTRWSCPHCHRSWSKRRSASDHIERCWFNPDNRSCKTCINYQPAYHGDGWTEGSSDEKCVKGVEFVPHEYREDIVMLSLHCEKWEAAA